MNIHAVMQMRYYSMKLPIRLAINVRAVKQKHTICKFIEDTAASASVIVMCRANTDGAKPLILANVQMSSRICDWFKIRGALYNNDRIGLSK